jgi:DNA-binding beta-propeller fold protein YncE
MGDSHKDGGLPLKDALQSALGLGLLAVCFVACSAGGDGNDNPPPAAYKSFAYVTNWGSENISVFSLNTRMGALVEVGGSPFAAGGNPGSIAVDPSGKFVFVVNDHYNSVSVFSINIGTGALTPITGSPFAVGDFPVSIAVVRIAQ